MLAFAYGIGVFWYDLLPGQLAERAWRGAAYPFAAIVLAEAIVPPFARAGPRPAACTSSPRRAARPQGRHRSFVWAWRSGAGALGAPCVPFAARGPALAHPR